MRQYPEDEPVDFVIVGTGAGGGTLACRLAEHGFSVVALDAGPFWRPLEDFASDEAEQSKLYLDRRAHRRRRGSACRWARNNSGQAVGGSHRAFRHGLAALPAGMVQVAAACSATARTGRSIGGRCGATTTRSSEALKIAGPVTLSLGAAAAALSLSRARGECRRRWCWRAARRRWALPGRRRRSPPSRRRAARRRPASIAASAHRLLDQRQAERAGHLDSARAARRGGDPRPRHGRPDRDWTAAAATGVHYHRDGQWRFQRARNVVVAGYAIETPRLLLNSACPAFPMASPTAPAWSGSNLMVQADQAVWGAMSTRRSAGTRGRPRSRSPSTGTTGQGQGFPRRLCAS